ncbi:phosphoribosylglycinamide formyltransferase [Roseobacter sp. N2S]|uniref:phosphoribosylglycinamide formyltransferase n=1 Tax=Roseobacter sp. N2S TaxID=2663844 RepID=UPI00285BF055|nr:phosphoribosylglycinamide formyltransferase [Roseobacter sp. N2S]MDR6265144.1 phosphoribosylglycinamide formyltransferase-1 [Roseobacter sp. N2S]
MVRVAVFISGGGSNMLSLLDAMDDPDFGAEPVLVLANSAQAGGLKKAADRGVATAVVDHKDYANRPSFEAEISKVLDEYVPDVICLAGFMRVLTADFTSQWDGKMLNIHPSLLPKYKGLHTHQRAIDAGDSQGGCSVHLVTAALDDGPILGQAAVPILAGDTSDDLAARVLIEEHKLYPTALRSFIKTL